MIHAFNPDVAKDVGIESAILYQNIQFWCEKNRLNGKNFHDGYYWTYNSVKAFCEMFPYMSKDTISRNLKKLEAFGYIKTGVFNEVGFDRTKWFADVRNHCDKMLPSISEKCEMDFAESQNGVSKNQKPIPNINTNINTDINIKKESKKESKSTFDDILDSVEIIRDNPDLRDSIIEYIKMRKLIKKPLTDRALKLNINEAYKLSGGNPDTMRRIIDQSVARSWAGVFPLKDEKEQSRDFFSDLLKEMEGTDEAGNIGEGDESLSIPLSNLLQG